MAPARKKQRLSIDGTAAIASDLVTDQGEASTTPAITGEKGATPAPSRSLFVRSLPANTTSESLAAFFSDSYPVKHAVAVTDPSTKEFRGYGFVTFADAEDAQKAKVEFNGQLLEGKKIRIELAEARERGDKAGGVKNEAKAKREAERSEAQQPPKLIVRNLPWTIKNNEQLGKLFMKYGKIKEAYIPKRSGGLLPGFGFIVMRSRKLAEKAIAGENGKEVDGRVIAVDWAVKKDIYQQAMETEVEEETVEPQDDEDDSIESDAATDEDEEHAEDGSSMTDQSDAEDEHDPEFDAEANRLEDRSATLFIRNLPFTCTDEDLEDHFTAFGPVRYARVVIDHATDRPKGSGFVCFRAKEDAEACLRGAPIRSAPTQSGKDGKAQGVTSILQNPDLDPSGKYTIDGRVAQVSRAVDKMEATKLTQDGIAQRNKRDRDKRRLYLLSEGTISTKSKLWESLPPSERTMRETSAKQRKALIEGNPSLHLSFTRLSVRNIPRGVGSKELKALAREAIVGFAKDVKDGKRQKLSDEELARGGDEMKAAEKHRRETGKGVVKQAKVVFETESGSKVEESSGAGRSRGYGFIEFHTHRNALMGLRWLNGHSIGYQVKDPEAKVDREALQDRKKRLIVEFAIENAQVVLRRQDRENKARERNNNQDAVPKDERKRKRGAPVVTEVEQESKTADGDKVAQRNRIIGRKRALRRAKRGSK